MTALVRVVNESVTGDPGAHIVEVIATDPQGAGRYPVQQLEAGQVSIPLRLCEDNALLVRAVRSKREPASARPSQPPG